jgi:prepilin-type N-terminal cleavage/methylation domain-containing protein
MTPRRSFVSFSRDTSPAVAPNRDRTLRPRVGRAVAPIECRSPAAFSLVEVLIVTAILSVIILGLVAMFGQTQRAFKLGMTQVDVLEGGRMAADLLQRELEQMTPAYQPGVGRLPNNMPVLQPNFAAYMPDFAPLVQALPGSTRQRTNLLYDVFFVMRRNQDWVGVGYFVRIANPVTGALSLPAASVPEPTLLAGTLYRFETNAPLRSGRTIAQMYYEFSQATLHSARASKLLDGVLHLRVSAFNTNGLRIFYDRGPYGVSASGTQTNATIILSDVVPGEVAQYFFLSNAVPASLDVELGVLEDEAWERYQALPDAASRYRYLTNLTGRVHLFYQRVAVRNVDPNAYR